MKQLFLIFQIILVLNCYKRDRKLFNNRMMQKQFVNETTADYSGIEILSSPSEPIATSSNVLDLDSNTVLQIGAEYQEFSGNTFFQPDGKLHPARFFQFTVDKVYEGQDLFIMLKAIRDLSTYPTLFISAKNKKPSLNNSDDTRCGTHGIGVCSIDPSQIQLGQIYYLGVYCSQQCTFGIKVSYQQEKILRLGDATFLNYTDSHSKLLKISVPENVLLIDRIIIAAHLVEGSQEAEAFYLYVNDGNENPSPEQFNYKGEEIWTTGKGVVIHNNTQNQIKAGQNYTIIIIAPGNTEIYLTSNFYGELTTIYLFDIIDDIVGPGETNTYRLYVGEYYQAILKENDLSFDINPYEGNPDLYITPPPLPKDLKDYKWQSQLDLGYESITLSDKNREVQQTEDLEFYLTIHGNSELSTYSFMFYISDRTTRELSKFSTETGYLQQHEVLQYQVAVIGEGTQNYTLAATFPEGSALLILKKCKMTQSQEDSTFIDQVVEYLTADDDNFFNCHINLEDIINYIEIPLSSDEKLEVSVNDQTSIIISGGSLGFSYNKTECEDGAPETANQYDAQKSRCIYMAGIFGLHETQTRYVLSLQGQDVITKLKEGVSVQAYLLQKDKHYYSFRLKKNDTDVMEVSFQFTVLNGDIEVWGSQTEKKPGPDNYELMAEYNLDIITFPISNGHLRTFYLTVEAESFSTYTIITNVIRVMIAIGEEISMMPKKEPIFINMFEGIPQRMTIRYSNQIEYFAFRVRNQQNENSTLVLNQSLFIKLECEIGQATAFIIAFPDGTLNNQLSLPSQTNYFWGLSSQIRILIISQEEPNYISNGEYRIAIYPESQDVVYDFSFSTNWNIIQLHLGKPYYGQLENGQVTYLELQLSTELEEITIVRTLGSNDDMTPDDDVELYVSLSHLYPSKQFNQFTLIGQSNSMLHLSYQDFNQTCSVDSLCKLHIAAQSKGGYNQFTILVKGVNQPTQLLEGVSQVLGSPIKNENEFIYLYYQVPKNKTIRIQSYSPLQSIILYANIVPYGEVLNFIRQLSNRNQLSQKDYGILQDSFKILFPTNDSYQFTSFSGSMYGSNLLIITEEESNVFMCSTDKYGCAVLVTTTIAQDDWSYDYITEFSYDRTFEIEASSELTTLKVGQSLEGFTQGGIMEYFKLVVTKEVKLIQISVTPLDDGDPDIYVKYQNSTEKEQFPTNQNYDFHSMAFKSDVLMIQSTDPLFDVHTIKGTYIIGVLGFSQTHFTIEATSSDIQYFTLSDGQIMDKILLKAKGKQDDYSNVKKYHIQNFNFQRVFFKYIHIRYESFRVILQKSSGKTDLGVSRHGNGPYWQTQAVSLLTSFPFYENNTAQWLLLDDDTLFGNILEINKTDSNYCDTCTYVFGVRNQDSKLGADISIVVGVDEQPILLLAGKTLFDRAYSNGNWYSFRITDDKITFQIKIYDGFADLYLYEQMSSYYGSNSPILTYSNISCSQTIILSDYVKDLENIFIKVQAQTRNTVTYSISGIHKTQKQIELGKSEFGTIAPQESVSFYYYSQRNNATHTLFMTYSREDNYISRANQPEVDVQFVPNENPNNITIDPEDTMLGIGSLQQVYILNKINGYYELNIRNNENYIIQFVTVLNQENVNFMVPNKALMSKSVYGAEKATNFEIFVREDQKLYLEVFECIGNIFVNFQSKNLQQSQLENQYVYVVNRNSDETGDIFFNIASSKGQRHHYKNHDNVESLYVTVPHLLKKASEIPSDIFFTGGQGKVTQLLEESNLVVQFKPLGCKFNDCLMDIEDAQPNMIIYQLHITNNQDFLQAFASCSLQIESVKSFIMDNKTIKEAIYHQKYFNIHKLENHELPSSDVNITIEMTTLNPLIQYYVQVVAQVYYTESANEPFTFEYIHSSFKLADLEKGSMSNKSTGGQKSRSEGSKTSESSIDISQKDESKQEKSEFFEKYVKPNQTELGIVGGVLLGILLILLVRYIWLKLRKSKLKFDRTKVRQDDDEIKAEK